MSSTGVKSVVTDPLKPEGQSKTLGLDPVQTLKDLDQRPNPNHEDENALMAANEQARLDKENNVTGNTPRTAQFATRSQNLQRGAAAAGAQRSENSADTLGYTSTTKRRSASRQILG